MPANHAIALFRECSRIVAILLVGVIAGAVVWFLAAWALLAIVSAVWPPVNTALDLTFPSAEQMLALMFALMMMPVFVFGGGFFGWAYATREKTSKG